jgi:predicted MarR family transcription regulator
MAEMGETPTAESFEELVNQTRGPREMIVVALRFYGGQANAHQLRRYDDIPSRNYHFKRLEKQGLIEQAGNETLSQGGDPAKVYRLTDLGQEVAEELDTETSTVTEIEDRLTELEDKIEDMDELLYGIAVRTGVLDEDDEEE